MRRRTWDAQTKALIVLEGLKGTPVAERCPEHQLRQSPSDQWRDQCLANAAQAFEVQQHTRQEAHLEQEHARLKPRVGELTCEFNKRDARWGGRAAARCGCRNGMRACSPGWRR
jgi:transposase-like protein